MASFKHKKFNFSTVYQCTVSRYTVEIYKATVSFGTLVIDHLKTLYYWQIKAAVFKNDLQVSLTVAHSTVHLQ